MLSNIDLAHDQNLNSRIVAVKLLSNIANNFGKELCESFVAFEFMCMADDPEQNVRKETAKNFLKICEAVSTDFFAKKLFPIYQKLADDKYWPVREASVKIITDISHICGQEIRETYLVEIYIKYCKDASEFVKHAAAHQIGKFIFSLKGSKIEPFLIQRYISLCPKKGAEEQLCYHCAYTFPAVLLTLGKEEWPTLKQTYLNMVYKEISQIRITLASSIHEVAKIVGPDITKEDLNPILKNFLNTISTAQSSLSHLHEFLAMIEDPDRLVYLDLVTEAIKNSKYNWRTRHIFAANAEAYSKLYNIDIVYEKIIPIIFKLLSDQVIEVRMKMCETTYPVVMLLKSNQKYFDAVLGNISEFSSSQGFRDKQTFLNICSGFMCNESVFDQYLLTDFLSLQQDRVVNGTEVTTDFLG